MIHIWTADVDESEKWSSQWIFQFMQLEIRSPTKIQASTGFEPVTSGLPVRCSTNWAMKPHIASKVNCGFPFSRHLHLQFIYESFHILYIISLLSRENGNPQLTLVPMRGFIAQLVEYRTGNAEVTGSNPVEGWIFFRLLISNCINWKIHCDDHFSLSGNRHVASIKSTITWNINFESQIKWIHESCMNLVTQTARLILRERVDFVRQQPDSVVWTKKLAPVSYMHPSLCCKKKQQQQQQ